VLFFPFLDGQPLLPVLPVQILWINLVATVSLALPLAGEAMEPGLMHRPPRRPTEPLLGPFVLFRTTVVALLMTAGAIGLFLWMYGVARRQEVLPPQALQEARTMAVTTVVLFQIFYLFSCRSLEGSVLRIGLLSNPAIFLGTGVLLLLQLAFVYLPSMNRWFGSTPLDAMAWGWATLAALVVIPVVGLEKWLRRRWRSRDPSCCGPDRFCGTIS